MLWVSEGVGALVCSGTSQPVGAGAGAYVCNALRRQKKEKGDEICSKG